MKVHDGYTIHICTCWDDVENICILASIHHQKADAYVCMMTAIMLYIIDYIYMIMFNIPGQAPNYVYNVMDACTCFVM